MIRSMIRTTSLLAFASVAATVPVCATTFSVSFTGIVSQTLGATGQAVGNTVAGHFDLDDVSRSFLDFTIAGQSIASGFTSSATLGPALTDAIYMAQVSPVSTGGPSNSTFTLDLSSLTTWPANETPFSLLTDTAQLANNLDTANRTGVNLPKHFQLLHCQCERPRCRFAGGQPDVDYCHRSGTGQLRTAWLFARRPRSLGPSPGVSSPP